MTDKTKKILTWGAIAAVVLLILYMVLKKKKPVAINPVTGAAIPSTPSSTFPLKMGSKGKEVEQLQAYLVRQYGAQFPLYGVDGDWGPETDATVKRLLNRDNVSKDAYDKWNLASIVTTVYK